MALPLNVILLLNATIDPMLFVKVIRFCVANSDLINISQHTYQPCCYQLKGELLKCILERSIA